MDDKDSELLVKTIRSWLGRIHLRGSILPGYIDARCEIWGKKTIADVQIDWVVVIPIRKCDSKSRDDLSISAVVVYQTRKFRATLSLSHTEIKSLRRR